MSHLRAGLFIGMALVMMLIVSPAMASINVVPASGGHVFIGEEGLDVSAALGAGSVTIGYYPGGRELTETPEVSMSVANTANFYVSPSTFEGKTGAWYALINGTAVASSNYIYVDSPKTSVSIRTPAGEDISGKSVPRGQDIDFRVETNLYTILERDAVGISDYAFKIVVTSPDGIVYTDLVTESGATKPLKNLPVDTSLWMWNADAATLGRWETAAKVDGTNVYKSGEYTVYALCNANSINDNTESNVLGTTKSVVKTVTIATDSLSITANKETIVRGDVFAVTISGIPSTAYTVYVKEGTSSNHPPKITPNQEGVSTINTYTATVTTSKSGTRTVGFTTDKNTDDKKWTVKVELGDKSDEVSIRVAEGKVTAVIEGDSSFYMGKEVKITGTNTETDTVYFFITGPNLPPSGGRLNDANEPVENGVESTFVSVDVKEDKTYEYKWDTSEIAVDSGSYSIYAVSEPVDKSHLEDAQYAITSATLRKPFITATVVPSNAARGDEIHIVGEAGVQTSQGVGIWIMGKNFVKYDTADVEDDGTYDYELKAGLTTDMATGQYYVVAQHPMYNNEFDVWIDGNYVVGSYPVDGNTLFKISGSGSLQGSDAAQALIEEIDNAAVDDVGASTQFVLDNPQISLVPISTVTIGNDFTVNGITNLAVGNDILVEVVSSSFGPTQKTQTSGFSGFSGSAKVVAGDNSWNKFGIVVDSDKFVVDEYIVKASAVLVDATGSTLFNAVEYVPTPTPTPTPVPTPVTPVPTTVTPVPTTETPTSVPTKESPGFGALIALVGIGATGYLVVRKTPEEDGN